jgi:hypothetical protein
MASSSYAFIQVCHRFAYMLHVARHWVAGRDNELYDCHKIREDLVPARQEWIVFYWLKHFDPGAGRIASTILEFR